jgi:hypothetical protein
VPGLDPGTHAVAAAWVPTHQIRGLKAHGSPRVIVEWALARVTRGGREITGPIDVGVMGVHKIMTRYYEPLMVTAKS